MGENRTVSAYERNLLELLLRHELPKDCEVQIEVKSKGGKAPGKATAKSSSKAVFALSGDAIDVKADMAGLRLKRIVNPTCW